MTTPTVEERIWQWATDTFPGEHSDKFERLLEIVAEHEAKVREEIYKALDGEKRKHNTPLDDGNDYDHGAWVALTRAQEIVRNNTKNV